MQLLKRRDQGGGLEGGEGDRRKAAISACPTPFVRHGGVVEREAEEEGERGKEEGEEGEGNEEDGKKNKHQVRKEGKMMKRCKQM